MPSSPFLRSPAPRPRIALPWVGIAAVLLAATISLSDAWHSVELRIFDTLMVKTAPGKVDLPITIVGIDEASFAHIKRQWPWPRSLHARLLDKLTEAGVAVAAFDVVFAEPSTGADDQAFAAAIRRHGNVVLAADTSYRETGATRQWLRVDPLPLFTDAGAMRGLASVQIDPDGILRQLPIARDAFWSQILKALEKRHTGVVAATETVPGSLIRYLGGPHTFTYIPYYQMLEPEKYLSANWKTFLKDNIVIIGRDLKSSTDVGSAQSDMFQTPFFSASHELMPGPEVQANLVASMASGDALRRASRSATMLLTLMTGCLSLLLMRRWTPVGSSLTGAALVILVAAIEYGLFAGPLVWLPAGGAALAVVLTYLAQGGVAYSTELRQRRQIRLAFEKYVAPAVVEQIVTRTEFLRPGGERQELTLLFTDLAGFTSIAEGMDAAEVANLLNRHLSEMTEIILRHKGTVDKFIGDAVMAFWGAPVADPDQSLHAVEAAIEMQHKVAAMRADVLAAGGPELAMRIGIHRGECIVGNMGGDNRFDYTAIGDAVNIASRLEGVNKFYGTGVLLSDAVATALAGRVRLRPVDTVRVKGKQSGIAIYTPCEDGRLNALSKSALDAYRQGDWSAAWERWQAVLIYRGEDAVAQLFLSRLRLWQQDGWPESWDGITTLETK